MKSAEHSRGCGKLLKVLFRIVLPILMGLASEATAQSGIILVGGGNQTLNITTGAPGSQPVSVVNITSTLQYWRQNKIDKITVGTSCPGQSFDLAVVATGVTRGVAAPQVTLTDGMLAVDFIRDIPKSGGWTSATISLQYTASATFAQGNSTEEGNDVHTVTYTLQVQ
jgi:hypothetical protein